MMLVCVIRKEGGKSASCNPKTWEPRGPFWLLPLGELDEAAYTGAHGESSYFQSRLEPAVKSLVRSDMLRQRRPNAYHHCRIFGPPGTPQLLFRRITHFPE